MHFYYAKLIKRTGYARLILPTTFLNYVFFAKLGEKK